MRPRRAASRMSRASSVVSMNQLQGGSVQTGSERAGGELADEGGIAKVGGQGNRRG